MALFKSLTGQNDFYLPSGKVIYVFRTNEGLQTTLVEPEIFEYIVYRARHETVLIKKSTNRIFLNDSIIPLMKIISDGDIIKVAEEKWQFIEVAKEILSEKTKILDMNKECKVCGDLFLLGHEVVQCPSCLNYSHYDCWEFVSGKCPNKICKYEDHQKRIETKMG